MSQERRTRSSKRLIPHTCRSHTVLETDARLEGESDPAVETYVVQRRFELNEALADPFTPVTGPVRDPYSAAITTGPSRSNSWENVEAQLVNGPVRRRVSLDGMWRAVGSPFGKGPLEWIVMARPLVRALNQHFANLAACGFHVKSNHRGYLFTAEEHLDDDRQAGDMITALWLVAEAYASFLDSVVSTDQ